MGWGPAANGPSVAHEWAKRLREQDPKFTALYIMRFRSFNDEDAKILYKALEDNHTLLELSSSHQCGPQQAADLSRALSCNTTLRSLRIGDSTFGDDSLRSLIPGIAASRSLKHLELGGAQLSSDVAEQLGVALSKGELTHLDFSGKTLKRGSLAALAPGLKKLSHLDLSACDLGGGATSDPTQADRDCDQGPAGTVLSPVLSAAELRILALSRNALGSDFCRQVAQSLAAAVQLTSLNISNNGIGPDGCVALVSQLSTATASNRQSISISPSEIAVNACQLSSLDVSGCGIGDAGFIAICAMIVRGAPLKTLVAGQAGISAAGLAAGLKKLEEATACRLQNLDVSGSHHCIQESSAACLGSLASLSKLSLFDCALGGDDSCGIEVLVQLLKDGRDVNGVKPFQHLVEMDLCGNELSKQQLQKLLEALHEECLALKVLVLGANPGTENSEAFVEAAQPLMNHRPQLDLIWRPPT